MSVRGVALVCACSALVMAACSLASDFDGLSNPPDAVDASLDAPSSIDTGTPDNGGSDGGSLVDATDAGTDAAACGYAGPTMGLIAYYPFDEGTGNKVHDCSPNKLDGTIVSPGTNGSWTVGKRGGAIQVSAPNGCVDLGTGTLQEPETFTVSAWIWIDAFPGPNASGYILGKANNAQFDGFRVGTRVDVDGGLPEIGFLQGGSSGDEQFAAPPKSTWHHIAVTFAASKLEMFLDGMSMHTKINPGTIPYSGTALLRIGCRTDNQNFYAGRIDELRFYGRVLTPTEITALAQ